MAKKIWIQFKDMESYRKNETKLCTLLSKAPGECTVLAYIRDVKKIRELYTYSFDEKQIGLLNNAFGEENVRYQQKIKWNKPTEVPKIKQIIPCNHDMYAVMTDSDRDEYKCYALLDNDEVCPLHFDRWLGISPLSEAAFDVELYEMKNGMIYSLGNC